MRVTVTFFAGLRELVDTNTLALDLPVGATVDAAVAHLLTHVPALRPVLSKCALFVKDRLVEDHSLVLSDGELLEVLPPYSGG